MPSPLFTLMEKFVTDQWIKLDREQITPWAFISAGPPFSVKDFYGKTISYQGVRFDGSPEHVFWARYIDPFLEAIVLKTMEEALRVCAQRRQNPKLLLEESAELLRALARKTFERMAEIDHRLRNYGAEHPARPKNVAPKIDAAEAYVDERLHSELIMIQSDKPSTLTLDGSGRTKVFISYAHADERWRKNISLHLSVLEKNGLVDLWDDRQIGAGNDWYEQIHGHMTGAKVALLLISASFLTSDFILREEVPRLFDKHAGDGMFVYPLLVRHCPWQEVPWLAKLQLRPTDARPLSDFQGAKRDAAISAVAREIASICKDPSQTRRSGADA